MAYNRVGAWLLGLEGVALLRAQAGDFDRDFVDARLDEVRRIVAALDQPPLSDDAEIGVMSPIDGYAQWSSSYDDGNNPLIDVEQAVVLSMVEQLPTGDALDAACGTGRFTRLLEQRQHRVIGVDSSPQMLAVAKEGTPQSSFLVGDLNALPVPDGSVDLVVCGLALTHLPELASPMAEFARVLRPGGRLITSDIHVLSLYFGGVVGASDKEGRPCHMPASRFFAGDYLRAALQAGLTAVDCQEPRWGGPGGGGPVAQQWCPAAADACYIDTPAAIIWQFEKQP